MEIIAKSTNIRITPRKLRLIADAFKNVPAALAVKQLQFVNKAGKIPVLKVLQSAIANGVNNFKLDANKLVVSNILIDEGPRLKRQDKSRNARVDRGVIHKKTSHIRVILKEV